MVGAHFLVEPRGNAYLIDEQTCADDFINTRAGLGKLLVALGGVECVNERLFPYLTARELCALSCVSRVLWTLIEVDENLWRDLALNELPPETLEARLLEIHAQQQHGKLGNLWKMVTTGHLLTKARRFKFGRLFCDALLRPLQCARVEIAEDWISRTNVTVMEMKNLSVDDFIAKFEAKRVPVLITTDGQLFASGITRWRRGLARGVETLQGSTKQVERFRAGPATLTGAAFARYAQCFEDENPLYIFDSEFGEKYPELARDYVVPPYFVGENRDLFERFPGKERPDYRWIIAGGAKSGSKWHVDPNCTHAWNVSLLGRKKWIMLPPGQAPPAGVFPSKDGGSVAQPVSLSEWFIEFYAETRRTRKADMIEFVADVGDIVFVPSGWWHCVLNLEESFAITQNYVASTNLQRALRFFDEKPDQISGLCRPATKTGLDRRLTFAKEFRSVLPKELIERRRTGEEEEKTDGFSWTSLVAEKKSGAAQPFKFNFGS